MKKLAFCALLLAALVASAAAYAGKCSPICYDGRTQCHPSCYRP